MNETTTQLADIREELEAAWRLVFNRELSDEDAETQRDAWSHLCSPCCDNPQTHQTPPLFGGLSE